MAIQKLLKLASLLILFLAFGMNIKPQDRMTPNYELTWAPLDKRFQIVVPEELRAVETDKLKDDQHIVFGHNKLYAAWQDKYAIGIYEFVLTSRGKKRTLDEKLDGLEFLIGGDANYDFAKTPLKINGLEAKLVTFRNSNAKGLMIDGTDRLYVLFLVTKDRKDLDTEMAKNFFSSFKLLK